MGFKASKKRERRPQERVGIGSPITPSYALELWYKKQIGELTEPMISDYFESLQKSFEDAEVKKFFGMDSASSFLTGLMSRLKRKWADVFAKQSINLAKKYVSKIDEAATSSVLNSLSVAGVQAPVAKYSQNVQNTINGFEEWNTTLVTKISEEIHEKIFNAVMASLTSPNPEQQGVAGIQNALKEVKEFSAKRRKFIAEDQTSKLYSVLADERMEQNGVEEFDWIHSGGGKYPRTCHEKMNGMTFKINDPRLWEIDGELGLKKGDLGPPGWAIGCRCKRRPRI